MRPVRQNPIQRTVSLFTWVCSSLCTIVAHNTAQNRPDNFPSCPPDNHHCSDDVYLRERGREACRLWIPIIYTFITPLPMSDDVFVLICWTLVASRGGQFRVLRRFWTVVNFASFRRRRRELAGDLFERLVLRFRDEEVEKEQKDEEKDDEHDERVLPQRRLHATRRTSSLI